MKIKLISDLHLDFFEDNSSGDLARTNVLNKIFTNSDFDILIDCGDISESTSLYSYVSQIMKYLKPEQLFIKIGGNHEYYLSSIPEVNKLLKSIEKIYPNFKFLNNEIFDRNNAKLF